MISDGSKQTKNIWPLPKFHFEVKWDNTTISFQEISGLDIEAQPIEYRHGDSPDFTPIKMPGLQKVSDVTMKRGICALDNKFWEWFNQIKMNTIKRIPVTINLLDENGKPSMVWRLQNAWPKKIEGTNMNSESNEVAIESIVIAHEGISVESI